MVKNAAWGEMAKIHACTWFGAMSQNEQAAEHGKKSKTTGEPAIFIVEFH